MSFKYEDYQKSAEYIKSRIGEFKPEIAMVLGSGLGGIGDGLKNPIIVDYADIPFFRQSTAPGHKGRLLFGETGGKKVVIMQGRLHSYEGYALDEITFPIRVFKLLGVENLILTNAAGVVNKEYHIGDIMMFTDHIKLALHSPLCGPNIPEFGERFFDMGSAYNPELQALARQSAAELGMILREGVYYMTTGPQYETPAEIRAMGILGADVIGMSTVPEVIVAHHCGIRTIAFSMCANMAAGVSDVPLCSDDVEEAAANAGPALSKLINLIISKI